MFERLKEIREYEGMTQQEVADYLQVERSTYAGWETGKDFIPLLQLNGYANFFKINLDYVVGNTDTLIQIKRAQNIDLDVVAKNLKKFRKSKNLTQKKIAKALNITQPMYSNYETGKTLITTHYALEFSKKYNYSLDKLVDRK